MIESRVADFSVIGIVLIFVLITVIAVSNRPRVVLYPAALVIQGPVRTTSIGWDRIAPGEPHRPPTENPSRITFRSATPIDGGYRLATRRLPTDWLHIEPAYLAASIRHYATHREDRAGIGTDAGLHHLDAALGHGGVTDPIRR